VARELKTAIEWVRNPLAEEDLAEAAEYGRGGIGSASIRQEQGLVK
jgi:hypothetical protein